MESHSDIPALQSLMDFKPQDDKRLATDHTSIMQSEVQTAAVATDRPATPPNQQQNSDTQPRSILKRRSSDMMHLANEQDSPTAAEVRRKVRFTSVDKLNEVVDEDRPRRSSTASPPPPSNHTATDDEDLASDDDEADHHYLDGGEEDVVAHAEFSPGTEVTANSEGYDSEADIDPLSPPPGRDSEGYDPNADIDPPSPTVEPHSTKTNTNRAEDVHKIGEAKAATPSGGVTVVGKFNFDLFRGTFSSSNVRVLDSEGYDPNADIDPPSDDDQDNDTDKAPTQAPMKIFSAGPTALPQSIKTTTATSPRRNAPSDPVSMTQPAKEISSTPVAAAASVGEPTKAPPRPLPAAPTFPHNRDTDEIIRLLRSTGRPFSAIANCVNEDFASRGLSGRIDANGVYSRLVMLNHIRGNNDENAGRDRANSRQSNLFTTSRTPASEASNGSREPGQKSKTTFSAKDDEALVKIYNEKRRRLWDDVALDMEKETGRKFDKRDLEERYAAAVRGQMMVRMERDSFMRSGGKEGGAKQGF